MKVYLLATKKLKEIRTKKGRTQSDMSSLISATSGRPISRSRYTRVEGGFGSVNIDHGLAISRILDVTLDKIFINKELANARTS